MQSVRNQVIGNQNSCSANAGLLLARYSEHASDSSDESNNSRRNLFETILKVNNNELYQNCYSRWSNSFDSGQIHQYKTDSNSRLIIGLGGENVTETGLTLSHTYGVPYLPGSAIKGLAAHYAHKVWGAIDKGFKVDGEFASLIFGNTNEGGLIEFHDAWAKPDNFNLHDDVMTPHHGEYYISNVGNDSEIPSPTDFDDPVPVTFLSVTGTFTIPITNRFDSTDHDLESRWENLTINLVTEALDQWGIGAKTSSGYGRMRKI